MGVNLEPTLEINVDPQVRFPFHGAGMARSRRRFGRMGEAEVALVIADVADEYERRQTILDSDHCIYYEIQGAIERPLGLCRQKSGFCVAARSQYWIQL
jgi:hypothetical protein